MSQIIALLDDKQFAHTLQRAIYQKYNLEVLVRSDLTETCSMLEILPEIELIITSEKLAIKLIQYLIKNHDTLEKEYAVIVIGKLQTIYPKATTVPLNASLAKIVSMAGFILKLEENPPSFEPPPAPPTPIKEEVASEESIAEEEKTTVFRMPDLHKTTPEVVRDKVEAPEFSPISKIYLHELPEIKLSFDIYTRLKKKEEYEYQLKFSKGETLKDEDRKGLINKGGKEFFVNKNEYAHAHAKLGEYFVQRLRNQELSLSERFHLNSEGYEILLDVFKYSSMDKYSVEIIKELLKSFDLLVKAPEALKIFFIHLKLKKMSVGYAHAHFTCVLLFLIIEKFSWSKDQSKNKLLYLCLFHDLALHNDRIIKLHYNLEHEKVNLTPEELELISHHADHAATVLETIVKAPKELTSIIREHHGMRSGKGFPESLPLGIMPISMAMIVIENFVGSYMNLMKEDDEVSKEELSELFNRLKMRYTKSTYVDVALELEKLFKEHTKSQ